MTARDLTAASPSTAPDAALAGSWKLAHGQAVTLQARTDAILRVAHGRLWATREGPHGRTPDDSGDHILQAGRSMYVRAGERVVVEAWTPEGAARFAWDPVAARAPVAAAAPRRVNTAAVLQPLAELRLALVLALRACAALARGVVLVACQAVRTRTFNNA
jgi:hypothetical protein